MILFQSLLPSIFLGRNVTDILWGKKLNLIFNKLCAEFCNPLVAELNAQCDV